jgi:hypothetical protein
MINKKQEIQKMIEQTQWDINYHQDKLSIASYKIELFKIELAQLQDE